ncbi:hypothetical protein [Jiulongibacter sp. NS-SX5]|uniref:hypothetical protein n=1 Tax=Jiulongibacter sp. NS-SX5 TaxID=3463854 RepID=UPI004058FC07
MKKLNLCLVLLLSLSLGTTGTFAQQKSPDFNTEKDLLLGHFDCKTDVDDLHTVAALVTLMANEAFHDVQYHAVAGTYGEQEGLYVPPNPLFQKAFGNNWSDAHADFEGAVNKVTAIAAKVLDSGGDLWIAEAGQSDFSAALIKSIQKLYPQMKIAERVHVVQHSNWNEEVTNQEDLAYTKATADYHKIPDGNAVGNGTPGFRNEAVANFDSDVKDPFLLSTWKMAFEISNKYNGVDGRYLNHAVEKGGYDFSDLSEVCYILGIADIKDTVEFFERF